MLPMTLFKPPGSEATALPTVPQQIPKQKQNFNYRPFPIYLVNKNGLGSNWNEKMTSSIMAISSVTGLGDFLKFLVTNH